MCQVIEQIIEVSKKAEMFDVLVPDIVDQLVKLPNTVSQERIRQRTVEQIVDFPVPKDVEELVEVSRVSHTAEIIEKFVIQTRGKTRQVVNIPLLQFNDKVVEMIFHGFGRELGRETRWRERETETRRKQGGTGRATKLFYDTSNDSSNNTTCWVHSTTS